MEILTLSVAGTLSILLAQMAEVIRPCFAQRVIVHVLSRATCSARTSAGPITPKKAA